MNDILQAIYDHFYTFPRNTPEAKRIEANHQRLIKRLKKQDRKLVLRIIDDKDLIANAVSLDSFIQGFQLAWTLSNQLNNYGGYPFDKETVDPEARHL
jgi:hypothetical protein